MHGEHRYKFSHRPNVPVVEAGLATVRLDAQYPASMRPAQRAADAAAAAAERAAAAVAAAELHLEEHTDGTRSIAIQTQYRDSAAQTLPYTPDFILPPGGGRPPEVLQLAALRVGGPPGQSLPIGRAEVAAMDLARRKARIEASLPPLTDEASFDLRRRLMEAMELADAGARESALDAAAEARLAAVEAALRAREAEREFVSEQRVEEQRRRLEREREGRMQDTAAKRVTLLRKISKQRQRAELHVDMLTGTGAFAGVAAAAAATPGAGKGRKATRDVIAEYADYGSGVYAPLLRTGKFPDKLRSATTLSANVLTGSTGIGPAPAAAAGMDGTIAPFAATNTAAGASGAGVRAATLVEELADLAVSVGVGAGLGKTMAAAEIARNSQRGSAFSPRSAAGVGAGAAASAGTTRSGLASLATPAQSAAASRKEAAVSADLERVHAAITTVKAGKSTTALENERVPAWRRPKPVVARPRTPNFDDVDDADDDVGLEAGVLLLQTLLRGRAVQDVMLAGKARRLELISEMRADLLSPEEAAALAAAEAARDAAARGAAAAAAAADAAAGEAAAAAADFFAAEGVRQAAVAKAAAAAEAADIERAAREAAEAATRRLELAAREREEEIRRQRDAVHAMAARSLIDGLLGSAVAAAAAAAAASEVRLMRRFLGPILEELEAEDTQRRAAAAAEAAAAAAAAAAHAAASGEAEAAEAAAAAAEAAAVASVAAADAATVGDILTSIVAPAVDRELAADAAAAEAAAGDSVAAEAASAAADAAAAAVAAAPEQDGKAGDADGSGGEGGKDGQGAAEGEEGQGGEGQGAPDAAPTEDAPPEAAAE